MPIYQTKCDKCDKIHDFVARISNYTTSIPECCNEKTRRYFSPSSAPQISTSSARFQSFMCDATGEVITNERQRKEVMAKNDLIDSRELGNADKWIKEDKRKKADIPKDENVSVEWSDGPA